MNGIDPVVRQTIPAAMDLVGLVRDFGAESVHEFVRARDRQQLEAIAVVLAAMVDPDKTLGELLGWVEPGLVPQHRPRPAVRVLSPCGTHAAYVRHKQRHETPCEQCTDAERIYQRNRKRENRQTPISAWRVS